MQKQKQKLDISALKVILYGLITGAVTGGVLSLFLVCARVLGSLAFGLYEQANAPLAVVCVLILSVLCCLLVAVIQKLVPGSKGSGIPLAEGAARGMLRVRWLANAAALIAGSLLAFICGMPLGSEGPSVAVGGLLGDGVGSVAKKPTEMRRHLITGGSCAGLAAAFNAPLTGLAFAFEETHRRFSPYILAVSFSAVISAVAVSQAAFFGFSHIEYLAALGIRAGAVPLSFLPQAAPVGLDILWLSLAALALGVLCAALGIGFNRAIVALSKLSGKIKSVTLRLLPAFILTAVFGLITAHAVGSGERTIEELALGALPLVVLGVFAMRFVMTVVAGGVGATGGLFLPMIAIGGLFGALAASLLVTLGLDPKYAPNIVVLCICAFFASTVRAPITAIIMSVELTLTFVNLLPCAIAVAVAVVLTDITKTEPLYEQALENLVKNAPEPKTLGDITVVGTVREGSKIAGKRIRNVMWAYNSLVIGLKRDGVVRVPDGETVLHVGDELTIRAENVDTDYFISNMREYIDLTEPHITAPPEPIPPRGYSATAKNKTQ